MKNINFVVRYAKKYSKAATMRDRKNDYSRKGKCKIKARDLV